jgi:hypothetical protein
MVPIFGDDPVQASIKAGVERSASCPSITISRQELYKVLDCSAQSRSTGSLLTGVVVVGVVVGLVVVVPFATRCHSKVVPKSFVRINTRPPLLEVNVCLIRVLLWYCMRYAIQTVADLETPISQCTSTDVPVSAAYLERFSGKWVRISAPA